MIDYFGAAAGATLWATQIVRAGKLVPPPPMLSLSGAPAQHVKTTVYYNRHSKADIWIPHKAAHAPVLVFVPGGGWLAGHRRLQGYALMQRLVEAGWICVAINYRTSPRHRWPAHFEDVRDALNWTRRNIKAYGADPEFIAVAGASAGGHMASLAGLAWDQFGITHRPDAVVSIYGVYDWRPRRTPMSHFVQALIAGDDPAVLEKASPIIHVREDAPPFYVLHGDRDGLVPVRGARKFYNALRYASRETVDYEEIVGAGHAFDLTDAVATPLVVDAIVDFLDEARENAKWKVAA